MENHNEQSQSYTINLLVRYGSLNSIYNEVFNYEKLTVFQQQKIYNFCILIIVQKVFQREIQF